MQELHRCVADDGAEIAYATSGEGPVLVLPAWWVSDLVDNWADPAWRALFERLGEHHTVVRYDRPGVGRSGGVRSTFTLDDEVRYLSAVVDQFDTEPVSFLSMSCGGPPAVRYSVAHPDRVRALVLYASYADGASLGPPDAREAMSALVRSTWGSVGSRTISDMFSPDATREEIADAARSQRLMATPEIAASLLELTYAMNVVDVAPQLTVPTLVLHRRKDRAVHVSNGRALAKLIPGAEMVELDGADHSMQAGDWESLVEEIERFLLGYTPATHATRRLACVLFTDIVDSTPLATELGDTAWRRRLDDHDQRSRRMVEHHGGRVVKTTGDGILATFDTPTQALGCAQGLHREAAKVTLRIRAGIHMGEVEERGDDVAGIAVNVAARVQSAADGGQTLVTSTVKDLAAGSAFAFGDGEVVQLKGVEGTWVLHPMT